MRKVHEEAEKLKQIEARKAVGDNYERLRLQKEKAPSFLSKNPNGDCSNKKKNQTLLSIQVSITPTKSGRIAIKAGDNLQKLAQNFCKAYQLGKDMEDSLVE